MEFIFMLTHDDRTVGNAMAVYRTLAGSDLRLIGFKDVGVDGTALSELTKAMHDDGRTVFLEVVSTSRDAELHSIEAALEVGVDYIMGGTHVDDALALIVEAEVSYLPFPGTVIGHPSILEGSLDEIADHAARLTARPGVTGLDLLAYRHRTVDPIALTEAVVAAASGPVVAAGSVDSAERIRALAGAGVWAFTIGGAIFEHRLPGAPSIPDQVNWVLEVAGQ
ncbi:MAG: 1-(5-phosphoribosyl)-5-((5-phosphoribosylamino)methylideneamino)imidazole-4-carboxamide isomerase [Acidimicrobiia bacterium]